MYETVWFQNEGVRLAGHLHWPDQAVFAPPYPAVVVCHGLGSRKERHAKFTEFLSDRGFAALAVDLRGHGESAGELDGNEPSDLVAAAQYLRSRPEIDGDRLAVRGSSLGGCCAIHAGANFSGFKAVVAVCPATESLLRSLLIQQRVAGVIDNNGMYARLRLPVYLERLGERDVAEAVEHLGPRALFLIHAQGDDTVPYQSSELLYVHASEPKKLLLLDGGTHWSAQHDPAVHDSVVAWLRTVLQLR